MCSFIHHILAFYRCCGFAWNSIGVTLSETSSRSVGLSKTESEQMNGMLCIFIFLFFYIPIYICYIDMHTIYIYIHMYVCIYIYVLPYNYIYIYKLHVMIIAGSSLQVKEDGEREAQKSLKRLQARPPWFLAVKQSWGI